MANETLAGTFTDIADAIRAKSGSSSPISPLNMGNEIRDLKDLTPASVPQSNLSAVFQDMADAIRECGVTGTMTPLEMPTKIGSIVVDTRPWLCFTAEEANSMVYMEAVGSAPTVSLEYSTDGETWSPLVPGVTSIVLDNIGDKVYVRATSAGNREFASSPSDYNKFVMTGKVAASGNVDTLLDQNGNATLVDSCYCRMFRDCTSLTTAPSLPATTLASSCYNGMFRNCTSLTQAPALPATALASSCYFEMFRGCTNLNTITLGYTGNFSTTYFNGWVNGVAASGTFYYNGSDTTTGTSAIPENWTITPFTP